MMKKYIFVLCVKSWGTAIFVLSFSVSVEVSFLECVALEDDEQCYLAATLTLSPISIALRE